MPKRKAKQITKKAALSDGVDFNGGEAKEPEIKKQRAEFTDPDVERQIAAIVGIRDVQIEHLLIELCMIRSYFDKHQLQIPALQFFEEKFPTMSVVRNGENGEIDVQCNLKYGNVSLNDGRYLCASLLPRLSLAYSDCSAAVQPFGGFDFSSEAGKARILAADNLRIKDFAYSQRMSLGMTPKTLRLPKAGEMLLSVHGSPLGIYKEDNMEAIHESEEG